MAKPIRATPELRGEIADAFIKRMINVENSKISKADKILSKEIKENSKYFFIC